MAYATTAHLKSFGISPELAFNLLWEHWNPRCEPPWGPDEVDHLRKKVSNAYEYNTSPPGNLTPKQLETWNAAYEPKNKAFRDANLRGKDLVRWKYQRYIKDYLRCVASVDDNVGRVLDWLDESGLADNTIVIYSSDQGFYLGDHGWFDKRFMYEESYRMPLMARWPGRIPAGSRCSALTTNLDFAETFLDIAGVEIPSDMQGHSLTTLFEGSVSDNWRDSLYYHYYEFYEDRRAAHMVRRHYGVRTDRYKLIHFYNVGEWELYDLEKDPREMTSVHGHADYAGVVKDLTAEVQRLQMHYQVPDDAGSVSANPPSASGKKPVGRKKKKSTK